MTFFPNDTFLSRVATVNERATLLSVIGEFHQHLQDDQLKSVEYCAIVQAFLSQLKPSIFGQLTEQEFLNVFGGALSLKFPRETFLLLIHSIGVGDSYKFSKTLSLLDLLMSPALREVLLLVSVNDAVENSSDEQFSRDICSLPVRVYNFLGSSLSSNEAVAVGERVIRKFEQQLIRGIQSAFQASVPLNISMCSKIVVSYCMVSDQFTKELLSWILGGTSNSSSKTFEWAQVFLNSEVDYRRQEQLVIKLVHLTSSGDDLKKIFGDSPFRDLRVKRIFVKKLLLERLSHPFQANQRQRVSQKIACYFNLLDPALLNETLLQLLRVFSDQSQFLESVNFGQQLQLCTAILDFAKKIKEQDISRMRQEVMQFLASAIPEYLQIADNTRRQMGMFLAETLANCFKCTKEGLHFDYSEDWILTELRTVAASDEQTPEEKDIGAESVIESGLIKEPLKLKNGDFRALALIDSDDDDDNCDQTEPLEAKINFSYLRECLDHLGAKESYINFEKALSALPILLEQKSTGEADIAQELLDRMICLEDRFRMPEFSELRSEVTSLILANHPELVAGAIRILFSNQCCMSNRYFILACIEKAARRLAIKDKNTSPIMLSKEDNSSQKENKLGKVVWKKSDVKPLSLCKNDFLPVSTLFIYPLMDLRWQGVHLDLYDRDHILLGKILITLGKLIIYAKFSPSQMRIISSLFTLLYRHRSNKHGFVFNGILFCYSSIAESLEDQNAFTVEIQDCLEWISEVAEEKVSIDPSILPLVQLTLKNIANALKCE